MVKSGNNTKNQNISYGTSYINHPRDIATFGCRGQGVAGRIVQVITQAGSGGMKSAEIAKRLKTTQRTVQRGIRKLKDQRIIVEKYGHYNVAGGVTLTPGSDLYSRDKYIKHSAHEKRDDFRAHAFRFTVKIQPGALWKGRRTVLDDRGIAYDEKRIKGGCQQLVFQGDTVQLRARSILYWLRDDVLTDHAWEGRRDLILEFTRKLQALQVHLGICLQVDGRYIWKLNREHYPLIRNELAKQHRLQGKKLYVAEEWGTFLVIDFSEGVDELEVWRNRHPDEFRSVQRADAVKKWWIDKDRHGWITDSFILESFQKLIDDRAYFAENMRSHVSAVQELGKQAKAQQKATVALTDAIRKLSERQTKLGDY